jgi:hypothetical protein
MTFEVEQLTSAMSEVENSVSQAFNERYRLSGDFEWKRLRWQFEEMRQLPAGECQLGDSCLAFLKPTKKHEQLQKHSMRNDSSRFTKSYLEA